MRRTWNRTVVNMGCQRYVALTCTHPFLPCQAPAWRAHVWYITGIHGTSPASHAAADLVACTSAALRLPGPSIPVRAPFLNVSSAGLPAVTWFMPQASFNAFLHSPLWHFKQTFSTYLPHGPKLPRRFSSILPCGMVLLQLLSRSCLPSVAYSALPSPSKTWHAHNSVASHSLSEHFFCLWRLSCLVLVSPFVQYLPACAYLPPFLLPMPARYSCRLYWPPLTPHFCYNTAWPLQNIHRMHGSALPAFPAARRLRRAFAFPRRNACTHARTHTTSTACLLHAFL